MVSEGCCAESVTRSFIFVFDNSYSKLRSKTCVYNIRVVDAVPEDASIGDVLVCSDGSGVEPDPMQSGESDDDSMCDYASAEEGRSRVEEDAYEEGRFATGGERVVSGESKVRRLSGASGLATGAGGAISVEGRGFSVDLVPLAESSRAVAAPEVPEQVSDYLK